MDIRPEGKPKTSKTLVTKLCFVMFLCQKSSCFLKAELSGHGAIVKKSSCFCEEMELLDIQEFENEGGYPPH